MLKQFFVPQGCKYDGPSESEGFDKQAGLWWIYPTNYPERQYQFNIIQKALFQNVLVSLPTGLGKTFIAAVVMYNYYRWFPNGKIIFLAPTKPLVKQQIDACFNIVGIPQDTTAELTGTKIQASRAEIWRTKRVIFATPQVLQNDLNTVDDLAKSIRCIVFDEAHKAKGNHAYCDVIKKMYSKNRCFRVLALSATPGNSWTDITEVVRNLLISHIEMRSEESLDVIPYVNTRTLETVVVPLNNEIQEIKDDFIQLLETYTRMLVANKVLSGNIASLTKGRIHYILNDFIAKNNKAQRNYGMILRNLNICISLYHAYDLLIRHGLRSFLSFCDENEKKPLLRGNTQLLAIMQKVRNFLGPEIILDPLPDGTMPQIPLDAKFGHPKFYKLQEILMQYFTDPNNKNSRVIVFTEYRDTAHELHAMLFTNRPTVEPKLFVGQASMTQKQQISVMNAFRAGKCNTLLSTCIGEEGLDIGEVNLIVCFDISSKSPIRMVQRMGRTGRKSKGRVIILVTEGREQQTLNDCLAHKNYISKLPTGEINKHIYVESPRMVPPDINPICTKMVLTIPKTDAKKSNSKKASTSKNTLKQMFENLSNSSSQDSTSSIVFAERIPQSNFLWNKSTPFGNLNTEKEINIEKTRSSQAINIRHSKKTNMVLELLALVDSKRYNLPTTELKDSNLLTRKTNMKQSDIRSMFAKTKSNEDFATNTQQPQKTNTELLTLGFDKEITHELFAEIDTYLTLKCFNSLECRICDNLFKCMNLNCQPKITPPIDFNDNCNVENITEDDFDKFIIKTKRQDDMESKMICNNTTRELFSMHDKAILQFFKLKSLTDLFDNNTSRNNDNFTKNVTPIKEESQILFDNSPVLFQGSFTSNNSNENSLKVVETSPILNSSCRVSEYRNKFKRKLMESQEENHNVNVSLIFDNISLSNFCDNLPLNENEKLDTSDYKKWLAPTQNLTDSFRFKTDDNCIDEQETLEVLSQKVQDVSDLSFITKNEDLNESIKPQWKEKEIEENACTKRKKDQSKLEENIIEKEKHNENDFEILTQKVGDVFDLSFFNNNSKFYTESSLQDDDCFSDLTQKVSKIKHKNFELSPAKIKESNNINSKNNFNDYLPMKSPKKKLDKRSMPQQETKKESQNDFETLSQNIGDVFDLSFFSNTSKNVNETSTHVNDNCFGALTQKVNIKKHKKIPTPQKVRKVCDSPLSLKNTKNLEESKTQLQNDKGDFAVLSQNIEDVFDLSFFESNNANKKDSTIKDDCFTACTQKIGSDFKISPVLNRSNKKTRRCLTISQRKSIKDKTNSVSDDEFSTLTQKLVFDSTFNTSKSKNTVNTFEDNAFDCLTQKLDDFCDTSLLNQGKSNKNKSFMKKPERCKKIDDTNNVMDELTQKINMENDTKTNNCDNDDNFGLLTQKIGDVFDMSFLSQKSPITNKKLTLNKAKSSENLKPKNKNVTNMSLSKNIQADYDDCDFTALTQKVNDVSRTFLKERQLNNASYRENKLKSLSLKANNSCDKVKTTPTKSSKLSLKKSPVVNKTVQKESTSALDLDDISSFCDISAFGFTNSPKKDTKTNKKRLRESSDEESQVTVTQAVDLVNKPKSGEFKIPAMPNKVSTVNKNPPKRKKSLNYSIEDSFSDDNSFESTSTFKLPEKLTKNKNTSKKTANKLKLNEYIEMEAEMSEDGDCSADEVISSDDEYEASFVNDTQSIVNCTQTHAMYLQLNKSPSLNRGTFKIPTKLREVENVYSQEVPYTENSYVNDSFCVDSEDEAEPEMSFLEVAEKILKDKKHKRKDEPSKKKRRRIIVLSSDSE